MRLLLVLTLAALPAVCAARVRIERTPAGVWQLTRDGKPYFVKGAVGAVHLDDLQAAGGNSIRAGVEDLDEAQRRGLTVLAGLPFGKQRWGFDYGDPSAVRSQLDKIRTIVAKHKDHPALLMWALGNELEIFTTAAQRRQLWKAIDDAARMIHEIDPNHPVITVMGADYRRDPLFEELKEQARSLDAIGLNAYKDMLTMPEDVDAHGWDKAYIVTEFGPIGHWQSPKTSWKMPVEQTSTDKAGFYLEAYRHAVEKRPNCLGAYVFHWAQHHEKTHTWYGMFLEDGSRTASVDAMQFVWSGNWPANRSPRIAPIRIEEAPRENIFAPGTTITCQTDVSDPDNDLPAIVWELRKDVADNPNVGGDAERPTPPIEGIVVAQDGPKATLKLPARPGAYRVFVYAHDGHHNAATANLSILLR